MDFREFLSKNATEVCLPYAAGKKVCNDKRTWRLREEILSGWYRFKEVGRYLEVIERTEPGLDEWNLCAIKGYFAQGRFVGDDAIARLHGQSEEEDLPRYTPLVARRWFDGSLWFEMSDFESEVEEAVREAFEAERGIAQIKAVTPALAQAFLLESTAREMAREAERRRQEAAAGAERAAELVRWQESIEGRIALALSHSGAELIDWRRSGGAQATVSYRLGGRRFECVIDTDTLQIVDAGICLEGADRSLSLSSLPSAVREAIDTGQLHVWRRV